VIDWLPVHPDVRAALKDAVAAPDPDRRQAQLVALAQYRLGYLETIQLDRALQQVPADTGSGLSPVRFALLASATVDHLLPAIRVAGVRRGLRIEIHVGPYGQYRQALLDPTSPLHRFCPQVVLLALSAREAIATIPLTATAADVAAALTAVTDELAGLWHQAREAFRADVLQQTILNVADPVFGSYDRLVPGAPARLIARLNDELADAAAANGVALVDVARASERDGLAEWFDATRWYQAKMEIAPQAAAAYGELVARVIAAQRGTARKCLVLDLDNTVWGGVVGDDGLEGIVLGEGSAAGEAHLALQRYAKQLRERGVILAVCSRNDPAIAEAAFRDHPEMVLERSDIAAFVATWDDKATNLRMIAEQLNIGLDSLVFLDDNPAERSRVRQSLPMVAVPELPDNAALFVRRLADAGCFEAVAFTSEDRQRGEQYAANAARDTLRQSAQSLDDFLRGLEMVVAFGPFRAVDVARITQLINKTNQFNPTTRRTTAQEVSAILADDRCLALQFRLLDRFGDNGLVSAMILRLDDREPEVLAVETWVMSCRVFGRQLEVEAMHIAIEAARRRGARSLVADYIPTPKNGVVRELYQTLGFTRSREAASADGATRWLLRLADHVTVPTHISRRAEQA